MDLILCRNVLMYFSKEAIIATTEKLERSLVTGGRLIVSAPEISLVQCQDLIPESPGGVTLYRKVDAAIPGVPHVIPEFYKPAPMHQVPVTPRVVSFPMADTGTGEEVLEEPRPPEPAMKESPAPPAQSVTNVDEYSAAARLVESGDYTGSEKILGPYLAKNPGDHRAMELMAQVLANRGDLSGARKWCEKAIALNKLNPVYHHLMATIRQEEGDFDAAAGELRRALYADPSYIPAHFTMAHLKRRQGKIEESDMYFRNARTLLRRFESDEIIGGTEGMSAGSLLQNITSMIGVEHEA